MATFNEAREELVAFFEGEYATKFPNITVYYENGELPNFTTQTDSFILLDSDLAESYQAELGNNPFKRVQFVMYLSMYQKEGTGASDINDLTDFFTDKLTAAPFAQLRVLGLRVAKPPDIPGWYGRALELSAQYDRA